MPFSKINVLLAAAALSLSASGVAAAQTAVPATAGATTAAAASKLTAGEVRKVDAEQGKVTIKHEAIASLDMPPMTMVFKAGKADMLKGMQVGDKVRFKAEKRDGAITVTELELAK